MRGADLLAEARAALGGGGAARQEALLLLAHAIGVERARLPPLHDLTLRDDQRHDFEAMIARRAAGQPISQILGWRDFWKHRFAISRDVLDPRPETEVLVAAALERPFRRVLDLGTGSGAILLSLLAERAAATGLGTDLSESALTVARKNAATLSLSERADFRCADWFDGVSGQFDLIVSNPPYIATHEMAGLDAQVRDWEPHLALTPQGDPGGDGLGAYRAIAAGMAGHLAAGGWLLVEIGPSQGSAVAGLLAASGLRGVTILPDLDGRDRVVTGQAATG